MRTLSRVLRWQIVCRVRDRVEIDWLAGTRLIAARGMTGLTGSIYYGLHEFHEMASVLHILRSGDAFADVGANAGAYTVLASGVVGAHTAAIEPGRAALAALKANITMNSLNRQVTVYECAVAAAPGEASFTEGAGTMNRLEETGTRRVPVMSLDGLCRVPTMIKIDVEGGELVAFHGAQEILGSDDLLCIVSESHDTEISGFLADFGFAKYRYNALTRTFHEDVAPRESAWFVRDMVGLLARINDATKTEVFGVWV